MAVELTQIANAQLRAGFPEDSIATTNAALEIALSHKTDPMFDSHLHFIWMTFMNADQFSRAVEVAKMSSSRKDIAEALEVIGSYQAQAGQLEQAQQLREEGEKIRNSIDDPHTKAFLLLTKAKNTRIRTESCGHIIESSYSRR